MPAAPLALRPARPAAAPRRAAPAAPRRRAALRVAAAGGRRAVSEADLYVGVDPPAPPPAPWYVTAPLGAAAALAALRLAGFLRRRARRAGGGGDGLDERGFRAPRVAEPGAFDRAMKGMRRVQYEELSDAAVAAARRRRAAEVEREDGPISLEGIELPENHPFASAAPVSDEEAELQRRRLAGNGGGRAAGGGGGGAGGGAGGAGRRAGRLSADDVELMARLRAEAAAMDAEQEARGG
jgi:hypothetical protein